MRSIARRDLIQWTCNVLWILCFALPAVSQGADPASGPAPVEVSGEKKTAAAQSGALTIKGSDTMVILGQRWAENYMKIHSGAKISVIGGGSGTGIAALINGTVDIAQASRAMKADEKRQFILNFKRKALEIPVALDGIVVVVNKQNPVKSLTLEQLRKIYRGEITDWKDLGGAPGAIVTYGRENSSGTYAYFKEHVLKEQDFSPRTQTLAGTAAIINAVSKDANGIGYSGHGYSEGVKMLALAAEEGAEAVEPDEAHVASGAYPLSRPLFFYVDQAKYTDMVADFVNYCLSPEGQAIVMETGYFPVQKKEKADGSASAEATPAATPEKRPE